MNILSRDHVLSLKAAQRDSLPLEYHARGDCVHYGKISRGCRTCFCRTTLSSYAFYTGAECQYKCGYCYYDPNRTDKTWGTDEKVRRNLAGFYEMMLHPQADIREVTYNSWGETLSYMPIIHEAAMMVKRYEKETGRSVYSHLYTNGYLATHKVLESLGEWGIKEIRFHMSAGNFFNLHSLRIAKEMGFIVTVEEPALPLHQRSILELLDSLQEIGIHHLNLVECQVTPFNLPWFQKEYSTYSIYRDHHWHLYDNGMVYDIIRVMALEPKKYTFSVMDCNSRVECCRASNQITRVPELLDLSMMDSAIL